MTNDGRWNGAVESPALTGNAVIALTEDAIVFEGAGKSLTAPFADIDAFSVQNYKLLINAETFSVAVSQMGRDTDVLYGQLWEAYNARTLQAFFVQDAPLFEAAGEYRYLDEGGKSVGAAKIKLYDNCLCILPPSCDGRRIPLCFMTEVQMVNFSIRMTLDTGEWYEVIRLGDRTRRLYELIEAGRTRIHENAVAAVCAIDGTLNAREAGDLARLMPDGAAAWISALRELAPSFIAAVEAKLTQSRAAETYGYFKQRCPAESLCVGIKTGLSWTEQEADIVWVTALREKDAGGIAAVELALGEEDAAATYLYQFTGGKTAFFKRLNHAMEAVSFHREVISITDEELKQSKNELYAMAVKRTGALRYLRACFAGRAIHRTLDTWKSQIDEWMK
jgi:hypothetical protein